MEILNGKITDVSPNGVTVYVPYTNIDRLILREYDEVQVAFPDGRRISPEQRRKAYALLGEIAEWVGDEVEEVKPVLKHEFVRAHLRQMERELFSLSDCDMTTAREFISYLIDFVLRNEVPTRVPLSELADDIDRYVYSCLIHKRCAVCGAKADLHHVDAVGMGNDRNEVEHIGRRCLPLCLVHHNEIHQRGTTEFLARYHLQPGVIDEKIAMIYRLRSKRGKKDA